MPDQLRFALIGAAGYVAPRHLKAVKETGHQLAAAYDPNDSVGILDAFFPEADFFTEFERFDRHIDKLKRIGKPIDYVSVCSPNYLHDAHIRFGLRNNAHVVCEKPLVLNPWNAEALIETERETGKKVNTILQLRLHPAVRALKTRIDQSREKHTVDLTYITPRGKWYHAGWKGEISKSGGIATNIGIHFFDMLTWIFGEAKETVVHLHTHDRAAGLLHLEKAVVRWFLSIDADTLPPEAAGKTFRAVTIDEQLFEFSDGFTDLHTESYRQILQNQGFGIEDILPATRLAHHIRNAQPTGTDKNAHPLAFLPLTNHPFQS